MGADVVQTDGFDDDSTRNAIAGSWGIFINNGYSNTVFQSLSYDLLPPRSRLGMTPIDHH
jgi:hypothetical protein